MPWDKSSHSEVTVVCERAVCASVKEDVVIALALTIAAVLGLSVVANTADTASIGFVLTATLLSLGLAPFVGDSLERYIPAAAWHRVSLSPTAYRRLGAPLYNSVLSASGWNRLIYVMRARDRSIASGNTSKRPLRASAVGHTWGLLLHGATAGWAAASGDWQVPLALVAIGVLVHLYPILIQFYVLTARRNS